MAIHKLEINKPIDMVATEAAIVPGKYGAQIRLKGSIGAPISDDRATVFLPGKVWAALKAFKMAGVIPNQDYNEEPQEGEEMPLPLNASEFELEYAKGASDKYANIKVTTLAGANAATRPAEKTNGSRPSTVASALSKNAGRDFTPEQFKGTLPEALRGQDEYEQNFADTVQGGGVPKMPMRQAYKALTEWTLKEIAPLYEAAGIGLSPEAAAAITATLFINADKRGKIE